MKMITKIHENTYVLLLCLFWGKFRRNYTFEMRATHQSHHRDNLFLRMRGRWTDNPTFRSVVF